MTFDEILTQVTDLLQREGRVAYRILKRRFDLSDDDLEDLKADLIDAKRMAADEGGKVLVWVGGGAKQESENRRIGESEKRQTASSDARPQTLDSPRPEAERRQLTVMFCDLVGSTALSEQLDPEELREVILAYQEVCAQVIRRFEGHLARYLGDGLLVYFSYPQAHEDDAQRAVRAGLEIGAALPQLNARLRQTVRVLQHLPLQVRIGIHTGLVVVGDMGGGGYRDSMAIVGETPNIAARLQEKAVPNSVVISPATQRLVAGLFECQDMGPQVLKGISTPLSVYRVVRESEAQSRFEVAVSKGLTPLVGREEELGLLLRRWEQAKAGEGQAVLLSGEPGIGKSRLVQALKEQVIAEGATRVEFRCSAYHQSSAFYPIIEYLQRLLQFQREDAPEKKLQKLEAALEVGAHGQWKGQAEAVPLQANIVPLFASLLSLPPPERYPPLTLTPQKQKEKTLEALVSWLVKKAEQAPVYCAWEDLHWVDPSTLEVLTLLLHQAPTTRLLALLTFRPDFTPPWDPRSYLSQLTLSRLGRPQVEAMVENVTGGKALPMEVVQQIVAKTDGVPLFVEELTKMVVESGLLREEDGRYVGAHGGAPIPPLAIPATLQDSLMARLDRLATVREIAQLGATLGREFSYELLHAISPLDEATLQQGLRQLVEAELLYHRGLPPQATYLFKHALIQDAAYQSLLKSTRQQYHSQIAQVLAERFPETVETQPELLAHHHTEAGLVGQAIPYWHKAGQRATQRLANVEAIAHLTKGLELLKAQPDTLERAQQELLLQLALGTPLIVTKSWAAPEVGAVYTRTQELCRQIGDTPLLFQALEGLWLFHFNRGEFQSARELAEHLLDLSQRQHDSAFLMGAHCALGTTLFRLGELVAAQEHLEKSIALADPQTSNPYASSFAYDPRIGSLSYTVWNLWMLGYMDQALKRGYETLTLAQELSHPFRLAFALGYIVRVHQLRREVHATQEQAEALIGLGTEQGFTVMTEMGRSLKGWALTEQGQEEGIEQMQQGIAAFRATGTSTLSSFLGLLAESYGKGRRTEEGLATVAEALALVDETGERFWEAELYRLKGQLTLQKFQVSSSKFQAQESPRSEVRSPESEAEECFKKAIEIARQQSAKSLELRAVMSLSRLWQRQGKKDEARQMLAEIYGWFTEGFDTKDLQEAKALLEELEGKGRDTPTQAVRS